MSRASAVILTGYVLLHLFTIFVTDRCLYENIQEKKYKRFRAVWLILYILGALIPIAGAFVNIESVKYPLQAVGNVILGYDLYYSGFLLIFSVIDQILDMIQRKRFKVSSKPLRPWAWIAPFVLAVIIPTGGIIHAQIPTITYWESDLTEGAENYKEMRVALIADLHLGVNSTPHLMQAMTTLVNASDPDIILIAGDIFNSTFEGMKDPEKYAEILKELHADQGIYAVYGNHDVDEELFGGFAITELHEAFRLKEMDAFVENCGFHILRDESVTLADGAVTLYGRIDGERAGDGTDNRMSPLELLENADKNTSVWVLEHEPWDFDDLSEAGADIVFCGHTHRGQIFPANLFVGLFNDNAYGYKNVDGLDTFVTSGVGYYGPPMRIATDSEVMIIDVKYPIEF